MNDYDAQHDPNNEQDALSDAINRAQAGKPSGDALIDALIGLQPQANASHQKQLEDALVKRMNTIHPNGHGKVTDSDAPITIEELKMTHKPKNTPSKRKRSGIPWTMAVAALVTLLVAGGLFFANQRGNESLPYASGEVEVVTSTPVSTGPTVLPPTVPPPGQGAPVVTVTPTFVPTSTPMPTVPGGPSPTFAPTSTPFPADDGLSAAPCQILVHTVEEGDTLMAIAGYYDVPVQEIIRANSLDQPTTLEIGELIAVPVGDCVFMRLKRNVESLVIRSAPELGDNEIGQWTHEDNLSLVTIWQQYQDWLMFVNFAANFSDDTTDRIQTGWINSEYVELIGSLEHVPQLQPFAAYYTATPLTSAQVEATASPTFTPTPTPLPTLAATASPTFTPTPTPVASVPATASPTFTSTPISAAIQAAPIDAIPSNSVILAFPPSSIVNTIDLQPNDRINIMATIFVAPVDSESTCYPLRSSTCQPQADATPRAVTQTFIRDALILDMGSGPFDFSESFPITEIPDDQAQNTEVPNTDNLDSQVIVLAVRAQEASILEWLLNSQIPLTVSLSDSETPTPPSAITPTFVPTQTAPSVTEPNMDYMVMIAIAVTDIPANTLIGAEQFTIGYMPRYGDSDNGQVLDQEIVEALQSGGSVYATEPIFARSIITNRVAEVRLGLPDVPEGRVAVAVPISRLGGDILPALAEAIAPGDDVHIMAELQMIEREDGSTCVQSINNDCDIDADATPVQIASLEIRDSLVLREGILATMSLSVENGDQIDDLLQEVFVIGISSDELDTFNWLMEEDIAFTLISADE